MITRASCRHHLCAIALMIVALSSAYAYSDGDVTFHKAHKGLGQITGKSDPYEAIPDEGGSIYVEKVPALTISISEIESVLVERQTRVGSYIVTFKFRANAAKRFSDLAMKHSGNVDIRVNGRRLSTPRLVGPFPGTTFSIGVSGLDEGSLREILKPLQALTTWS